MTDNTARLLKDIADATVRAARLIADSRAGYSECSEADTVAFTVASALEGLAAAIERLEHERDA